MKIIAINKKTAVQGDGSIIKWVKVVDEGVDGTGGADCPLCKLYNNYWTKNTVPRSCEFCPIGMDTGDFCEGSPFADYADARVIDGIDGVDRTEERLHAKAMLEYLQGLKARCEVVPGLRQNYVKGES